MKNQSFTHLITWQVCHRLVINVYKITCKFPREESFGLSQQLRRAIVSVTSNIAEVYGRISFRDTLRFYVIAGSSLTEVKNQLIIAKDVGYNKKKEYIVLDELLIRSHKLVLGLIRATKERI